MREKYSATLEKLPRITLRLFAPMIKATEAENAKHPENRGTAYSLWSFSLGGVEYRVKYTKRAFSFQWQNEDGEKEQTIKVVAKPSNLPALKDSSVYYFVDSYSGEYCRSLWYVGFGFLGRRSFRCHYYRQNVSRSTRLFGANPITKDRKRKFYYRGKITPYGKRVNKYMEKEPQRIDYFFKMFGKYLIK